MNKNIRNGIIFTGAIVAVAIITIGLFYIASFKTVAFSLVPDDLEGITVYNSDEQEVATLDDDGELRLQTGEYTYTPRGERYSTDPVSFSVDNNKEITVNPSYSAKYREDILRTENTKIVGVINATYSDVMGNFIINTGTIYQQGDWYATTLDQNPLPGGQQGDTYRVVLQKKDNLWHIVAGPEIVLSAQEYTDVPVDILRDINSK